MNESANLELNIITIDVDPRRDDDASPMSSKRIKVQLADTQMWM